MTASSITASTSLKAKPEALQGMRHWLDARFSQFGLSGTLKEELILAINEACMNIIQHAYGGSDKGEIRLSLQLLDDHLAIELEDDAPCIDPNSVKPRPLEELRPGGLGVHFIREILDEMAFLPCGDRGNRLRLVKRLGKQ